MTKKFILAEAALRWWDWSDRVFKGRYGYLTAAQVENFWIECDCEDEARNDLYGIDAFGDNGLSYPSSAEVIDYING